MLARTLHPQVLHFRAQDCKLRLLRLLCNFNYCSCAQDLAPRLLHLCTGLQPHLLCSLHKQTAHSCSVIVMYLLYFLCFNITVTDDVIADVLYSGYRSQIGSLLLPLALHLTGRQLGYLLFGISFYFLAHFDDYKHNFLQT